MDSPRPDPRRRGSAVAGPGGALRQGTRALLLRRPLPTRRFAPGAVFVLLLPIALLDLALGRVSVAGRVTGWRWELLEQVPLLFEPAGLITSLATIALLLLSAWMAAASLARPALLWSLAAPLGVAWLLLSLAFGVATLWLAFGVEDAWPLYQWLRAGVALYWLLLAWRLLAGLARDSGRRRRLAATLLASVPLAAGWWLHAWPDYWTPDYEALAARGADDATVDAAAIDHEAVIYAQPSLLEQSLRSLAPQRPGMVDLYALGFAGDGSEQVFANEARHFAALAAQRYDAEGRTLALVNAGDDPLLQPMATLTALRGALAAIGAHMDREQDLLWLFVTTHGSEEHELLVQLGDLPLSQVTPEALRQALDDSGIRNRIVVVSACYAGGFVEALANPDSIVIAAARADRTSFGCGTASEVTWFGEAFLVRGLARERDPLQAFALAREFVAERERQQDVTASEPQLHAGERISTWLPGWIAALPPAAPVPYRP